MEGGKIIIVPAGERIVLKGEKGAKPGRGQTGGIREGGNQKEIRTESRNGKVKKWLDKLEIYFRVAKGEEGASNAAPSRKGENERGRAGKNKERK